MSTVAEEKKEETTPSQYSESVFADKFFSNVLGSQMMQAAYIGDKLGWYQALQGVPKGLTPDELATKTKTSGRYAREWLEMHAVAGWVYCPNPEEPDGTKRVYVLPPGHASVLADIDSLSYMMPLAVLLGGTGKALDKLTDAYRDNTGVSWDQIGDDARNAQAAMNRPFFLQSLPTLLESVLDTAIVEKLHSKKGKIADIGAGYAWSSIGLARHFQGASIDVYDLDEPSIVQARKNIAQANLDSRIVAHCADAAEVFDKKQENFDLVLALECVHDMPDPISVLRTMRQMAGPSGTVIVMDERVNEKFSVDENPIELAFYGFSCLCCLADGKSSGGKSVETGTVMRPCLFRMYAQQAGFREVEILGIEHDFYRFYKLLQ